MGSVQRKMTSRKMIRNYGEIQHSARIEPMSPTTLHLNFTTKPWVCVSVSKKKTVEESLNQSSKLEPILRVRKPCIDWAIFDFWSIFFLYMAFWHRFSFATDLAANFRSKFTGDRFKILPEIALKFKRTGIWSGCAVRLESEPTPCSWAYWSAALHRIRLGTCEFVVIPYFRSETNDWSKDWGNWWARLWSENIKTFLTVELSQYCHSGCTSSQSRSRPAVTAANLETPCLCACASDPPMLCRSPAERARLLILLLSSCSQNLRLSSGTGWGSDCQMTCRGSNLDSNLKFCLRNHKRNCMEF